jgi:Leucine-rich repeat (LRR) protein
MTAMRFLNLRNNQFEGALPDTIVNLANLEELILSLNDFTDALPAGFGNQYTKLHTLSLRQNQFSGDLPEGIFTSRALVTV